MSAFKGLSPFDPRFWSQLDRMAAICAQHEASSRGGRLVEAPSKEVVCMRLTNNLGEGEYEFAEQEPVPGGGWRLKQGGATYAGGGHARSGRCHESNLNARVPVPSMQVGTVKYASDGTPSYRFLNCCQVVPTSGSGASDDPTTTDDGIAEVTTLANWMCTRTTNGCKVPVLVFQTHRYEAGGVPRLIRIRFTFLNDCAFDPCTPTPASGGGSGEGGVWDVWRRCNVSADLPYPQEGDILLDPSVYTIAHDTTFAEPVYQPGGEGPCYYWQGLAEGEPIESGGIIRDGCGSEECNNCDCDATCLLVTAPSGDSIMYTIEPPQTFCDYDTSTFESSGPNGGLQSALFNFVDNAWRINVVGPGGAWNGNYGLGDNSGCPGGEYHLIQTHAGTPPSIITVGTCPCATAMRIAGYVDGMFGQIRRSDPDPEGDCEDCGSFTANGDDVTGLPTWDGTLTAVAGTEFTIGGGFTYSTKMKISGATETAIREDTGTGTTTILGTDYHTYTHRFKCANLSSLTYRRIKALGKPGEYELYQAGVSADTIACGQPWPQTITLECFTPP